MSMFNIIRKEFQYGQHTVVLETGRVARQNKHCCDHHGWCTGSCCNRCSTKSKSKAKTSSR